MLNMSHHAVDKRSTQTIDQLNSFLRGELAAVETYEHALRTLAEFEEREARDVLEQCANSHQRRVNILAREVRRRGGRPACSSGPWGMFARAVESTSAKVSERVAIAILEEGEDHGRNDYDRDIEKLDVDGRAFVAQALMPEQIRTHGAMSELKKTIE
jgi:demethoxyubiquinone hydroxylase (CLK1/Coq7/Cat5 family)